MVSKEEINKGATSSGAGIEFEKVKNVDDPDYGVKLLATTAIELEAIESIRRNDKESRFMSGKKNNV